MVPLLVIGLLISLGIGDSLGTQPRLPTAPPPAAAPRTEPAVRVEHDLVSVRPARRRPSLPRAARGTRLVRVTDALPAPLLVRAGRMVVGDGRFRPEPFPRPDR
jgi:hypothetical protein